MNVEMNDKDKVCQRPCISWSAIILGALIACGLSFLLNLFYLGVGISAFTFGAEGAITLLMGGFLCLALTSFAAMFFAGWVAGRLGRIQTGTTLRGMGELYGLAAWCLSLLLMAGLTANTSNLIGVSTMVLNPGFVNVQSSVQKDKSERVIHQLARKMPSATEAPVSQSEENAKVMGATTFATFFIFFLGALASAFGGHCGLFYRRSQCTYNTSQ